MAKPLLNREVTIRQGAYLPHWTAAGAIYHTVFRLADALPAAVMGRHRSEREALLSAEVGTLPTPVVQDRPHGLFHERIERFLDTGHGARWLERDDIAGIAAGALRHFDGTRYDLHAWCVMPNHVHAAVRPRDGYGLSALLHAWKSYTATAANRMLGRKGEFRQKESYDHLVRDETDLMRTLRYVAENPIKANLPDWPRAGPKA